MHRCACARLIESADAEIQIILDALKNSGRENNIPIILSKDYGENDAAHS